MAHSNKENWQEDLRKALESFETGWEDKVKEANINRYNNLKTLHNSSKWQEWSSKGGYANIDNLLKWCKENNHYETLEILQKGYEKSEEHKKKISETLKGRTLSEETKTKMSESRTGMKFTDERKDKLKKAARKRMRPVLQYDLDGYFIREWGGFAEIVDELKVSKSPVYSCCKGYTNKAHGYIWKYKDEK